MNLFFHPKVQMQKNKTKTKLFITGFPWAARRLARQKFIIETVTSPRALSHGLYCVHRLCQESARSKSGLESGSAKPTVAGRGAFLKLGISTAQHFSHLHPHSQSSTCSGDSAVFFFFFSFPLAF